MSDVPGKFFKATKVRTGVSPSSPGVIEGETLPPVNPPGGSLNSVGLSMPSAFNVANSPLTSNGTLAVTGAGTVGQYIRGDGSLADFPQASGGGSSVSYYLNGSVDQGTIGGVAYRELSKVPILGAGTDFTINADGYIASFITDAGDPNLLEIPGGNWNFETYFSASSSGGTPTFYVELYKVSGTTATLIASSSSVPELIAFGTNLTPYYSTLAVPTTTLALTDRLAIRYYVSHSGRTITLHTENNHLCQIITTFTTGLTALNGLTAQVQNFAVGTSGTDFNIASATATHTFNLPTASATNRGALSSADWSLFRQAYNDKINSASVTGTTTKTLTLVQQDGGEIQASWSDLNTDAVTSVFGRTGAVVAVSGDYNTSQVTESGNLYFTQARVSANTDVAANTAARHNAVTLGTANGLSLSTQQLSLGLASGSTTGALSSTDWNTFNNKQPAGNYVTTDTPQTISGEKTFTNSIILKNSSGLNGLVLSSFSPDRLQIGGVTYASQIIFPATSRTWNLPDATGTIALVGGSGVGTVTNVAALTLGTSGTDLSSTVANSTTTPVITLNVPTASATNRGALSAADWTTFNNKQNALTNPVTGTGVNGRVAFWNGTNSITSDADLLFNGSELNVSGIKIDGSFIPYIISTLAGSDLNIQFPVGQGLAINNNGAENIARISKNNFSLIGASTIQTSTGNMTISTGGGNGNIILSPNGSGTTTINSNVTASSFIRSGGTSAQFLKADGSVDSNTYYLASNPSAFIALTALSGVAPIQYNNTTGAISITQASGSQSGFLSSTDWNTFNNKQNALTNPVTGTGTTNYLPKFTGSTTIGNSQVFDNGTLVGIGTANPLYKLDVRRSGTTSGEVFSVGNTGSGDFGGLAVSDGGSYPVRMWATQLEFYAGNSAYASASEAMRIFSSRNVHIGPTPVSDNGARLQVSGRAYINNVGSSVAGTTIYGNDQANVRLRLENVNGRTWELTGGLTGANNSDFTIYDVTAAATRMTISSTGAATFSSSVTATSFSVGNGTLSNSGFWGTLITAGTGSFANFAVIDSGTTRIMHNPTGTLNMVFNGNVGIGRTVTYTRLQVAGDISAGYADSIYLDFFDAPNAYKKGFSGVNQSTGSARGLHIFNYDNDSNDGINFWSGTNASRLFLGKFFPDGNFFIGSSPSNNGARLQVSGTSTFSGELNLQYNNAIQTIQGNTGFSLIRLYGGNGSSSNVVEFQIRNRVDGGDFSTIGNFSNHDLQIRTNNTARLTIAASTGAATFSGSLALPHTTKTANYTLDATDYTVGFDCASNRTATLPDATTCAGRVYVIYQYNTGSGVRSVTLDGNGSQTINGATTYSLSPYCDFTSVMIQSNGSNWIIISSNLTANCL